MRGSVFFAGLAGVALLALSRALPRQWRRTSTSIDRVTGTTGSRRQSSAPPEGVRGRDAPAHSSIASFDRQFRWYDHVRRDRDRSRLCPCLPRSLTAHGDGFITGFEQTDWAASCCDPTGDVLANAMTFDIDLDRSVTRVRVHCGRMQSSLPGQINPTTMASCAIR
jgi:hypothetical protein